MSSRGRGSHSPAPQRPGQVLWWLIMIAAAVIGGLAAATLVHGSLLVAVIVSIVLGAVLAIVPWPGPPAELPSAGRQHPRSGPLGQAPVSSRAVSASPSSPSSHADTGWSPAQPPEAPGLDGFANGGTRPSGPPEENESVVQLLPLSSGQASNSSWWDAAQGAPPAPSRGAQRVPAPDLSTYLASTLIAQCPRCGAFRLDYRNERNGLGFRCKSCEYTWTWRPGTPWPPVRVMPARRKETRPPSP